MKNPVVVSIVIPTFNSARFLRSTLDSVLAQTLNASQWELIVVDDGSTDKTLVLAKEYLKNVANARVIHQQNGGVARARNRGWREARGQWIAFLDHDDIWLPRKLELQLAQAARHGVVGCFWEKMDESGALFFQRDEVFCAEGNVFKTLLRGNFIISMSLPLVRRALLEKIGGFDPETVPCDDWDLWLRLAKLTTFGCVREVLVRYRKHENQQSRDELQMWRATQKTLVKQWARAWRDPKMLWIILAFPAFLRTVQPFYNRARAAVERGDWHQVSRQIFLCCLRWPFCLLVPQWLYILKRLIRRDATPF